MEDGGHFKAKCGTAINKVSFAMMTGCIEGPNCLSYMVRGPYAVPPCHKKAINDLPKLHAQLAYILYLRL